MTGPGQGGRKKRQRADGDEWDTEIAGKDVQGARAHVHAFGRGFASCRRGDRTRGQQLVHLEDPGASNSAFSQPNLLDGVQAHAPAAGAFTPPTSAFQSYETHEQRAPGRDGKKPIHERLSGTPTAQKLLQDRLAHSKLALAGRLRLKPGGSSSLNSAAPAAPHAISMPGPALGGAVVLPAPGVELQHQASKRVGGSQRGRGVLRQTARGRGRGGGGPARGSAPKKLRVLPPPPALPDERVAGSTTVPRTASSSSNPPFALLSRTSSASAHAPPGEPAARFSPVTPTPSALPDRSRPASAFSSCAAPKDPAAEPPHVSLPLAAAAAAADPPLASPLLPLTVEIPSSANPSPLPETGSSSEAPVPPSVSDARSATPAPVPTDVPPAPVPVGVPPISTSTPVSASVPSPVPLRPGAATAPDAVSASCLPLTLQRAEQEAVPGEAVGGPDCLCGYKQEYEEAYRLEKLREEERDDALGRLELAREKLAIAALDAERLRDAEARLTAECESLRRALDGANARRLQDLEEHTAAARAQLDAERAASAAAREEVRRLKAEVEAARVEGQQLRRKLDNARREAKEARKSADERFDALQRMERLLKQEQDLVEKKEAALQRRIEEAEERERLIRGLTGELDEAQEEHRDAERREAEAERRAQEAEARARAVEEANDKLNEDLRTNQRLLNDVLSASAGPGTSAGGGGPSPSLDALRAELAKALQALDAERAEGRRLKKDKSKLQAINLELEALNESLRRAPASSSGEVHQAAPSSTELKAARDELETARKEIQKARESKAHLLRIVLLNLQPKRFNRNIEITVKRSVGAERSVFEGAFAVFCQRSGGGGGTAGFFTQAMRCPIVVRFVGEAAVDRGGPLRDFFRQFFDDAMRAGEGRLLERPEIGDEAQGVLPVAGGAEPKKCLQLRDKYRFLGIMIARALVGYLMDPAEWDPLPAAIVPLLPLLIMPIADESPKGKAGASEREKWMDLWRHFLNPNLHRKLVEPGPDPESVGVYLDGCPGVEDVNDPKYILTDGTRDELLAKAAEWQLVGARRSHINAMRRGLREVLKEALDAIALFSVEELSRHVGGVAWTADVLIANLNFDEEEWKEYGEDLATARQWLFDALKLYEEDPSAPGAVSPSAFATAAGRAWAPCTGDHDQCLALKFTIKPKLMPAEEDSEGRTLARPPSVHAQPFFRTCHNRVELPGVPLEGGDEAARRRLYAGAIAAACRPELLAFDVK